MVSKTETEIRKEAEEMARIKIYIQYLEKRGYIVRKEKEMLGVRF